MERLRQKVEIEILNWEKFNPRKDVTNPSWFRLEHSFMFDPEWDHLDGQEIAVWIYLLAYASFKKPVFDFDIDTIARKARVTKAKAETAIEKLKDLQCISVTSRARDADVTPTCTTERNERNVTGRNETKRDGVFSDDIFKPQDLADLWNAHCSSLPKASKLNSTRTSKARDQIKKHPAPEYWLEAIAKFTKSDFCLNQWRPCFDDLLHETKRLKALEGAYDNRQNGTNANQNFAQRRQSNNLSLLKRVEAGEI